MILVISFLPFLLSPESYLIDLILIVNPYPFTCFWYLLPSFKDRQARKYIPSWIDPVLLLLQSHSLLLSSFLHYLSHYHCCCHHHCLPVIFFCPKLPQKRLKLHFWSHQVCLCLDLHRKGRALNIHINALFYLPNMFCEIYNYHHFLILLFIQLAHQFEIWV